MSNGENTKDFVGIGLPLEAKGWLSPPDSICSSSTDSGITLAEMSLPDSFNDQEDIGQPLLHGSGSKDTTDFQNTTPHSQTASREILDSPHRSKYTEADNTPIGSFKSTPSDPNEYPLAVASPSDESIIVCPDTSHPVNENRDVMSGGKDEICSLNKVIIKDETRDATHASSRVGRGKSNAYPIKSLTCTVFVFPFLFSVYICCFFRALLTKSANLRIIILTFLSFFIFGIKNKSKWVIM